MTDQDLRVVQAMSKWGGSFVKCLAECFYRADHRNFTKLRLTFSEYWETYKAMAQREDEQNGKE